MERLFKMSHVTNILILAPLIEARSDAISNINNYLNNLNKGSLKTIDSCSGGTKAMEVSVYAGAFNYLDIEEFLEAFKEAPWREKDRIQLLICDQDDDKFSLHEVV